MNQKRTWIGSAAFCVCAMLAARTAYALPPSDPCELLTQAQVSSVLGASTGAPEKVASKFCQWTVPGGAPGNVKRVSLTLQDERAFEYAKMPVPGGKITKTPMSGIGDDAVYGVTENVMATLTVKKGSIVFTIRVYGFPLDQVQMMEKTLAMDALGHF